MRKAKRVVPANVQTDEYENVIAYMPMRNSRKIKSTAGDGMRLVRVYYRSDDGKEAIISVCRGGKYRRPEWASTKIFELRKSSLKKAYAALESHP